MPAVVPRRKEVNLAERRALPRMPLQRVVHLKLAGEEGQQPALLLDISADGAFLLSETYYEPGRELELLLTVNSPAVQAQLRFNGRVVRSANLHPCIGTALAFADRALSVGTPGLDRGAHTAA